MHGNYNKWENISKYITEGKNDMANIVKLGSLYSYADNSEIPIGTPVHCPVILKNTNRENPIPWVDCGDKLVSAKTLVTKISWNQANLTGLITGTIVEIDGQHYLCRSLKVGRRDGLKNEWDTLLDKYSDSNDLWHWQNSYFWGQENGVRDPEKGDVKVVRGWKSARYRNGFRRTTSSPGIGIRLVLEPIKGSPKVDKSMIGRNVTLFSTKGMISGRFCGFTDYDIVITGEIPSWKSDAYKGWAVPDENRQITVDRSAILYIK